GNVGQGPLNFRAKHIGRGACARDAQPRLSPSESCEKAVAPNPRLAKGMDRVNPSSIYHRSLVALGTVNSAEGDSSIDREDRVGIRAVQDVVYVDSGLEEPLPNALEIGARGPVVKTDDHRVLRTKAAIQKTEN